MRGDVDRQVQLAVKEHCGVRDRLRDGGLTNRQNPAVTFARCPSRAREIWLSSRAKLAKTTSEPMSNVLSSQPKSRSPTFGVLTRVVSAGQKIVSPAILMPLFQTAGEGRRRGGWDVS